MSEATLNQIRQIAANIFDVPVADVVATSSPDTIESWDSLAQLNLILALEEQFQSQFGPEEIEQMLTIESIAILVDEKVNCNNGS
jgi:acyl carrier protein